MHTPLYTYMLDMQLNRKHKTKNGLRLEFNLKLDFNVFLD